MSRLRQGFGEPGLRLRQGFGGPGLGPRVLAAITILLFPIAVIAQQRDARPTPAPAGTGEITGVVWSADQPPQPLRRVIVSITGGTLAGMRSVLTDDGGTFTFGRLAAGTYAITALKPAYLPAAYGSMKPGRPGAPIALAAGQRMAIAVTMFKGAAIAGTVHDSSGLPVGGITVSATDARNPGGPATPGLLPPRSTVTDDRGAFRLFELMPGAYLIGASLSSTGDGLIGARSPAEMDALLSTLAQRHKGVTTAGAAAQPPPAMSLPDSVGYAPIYFPGTAWRSEAVSIKVAPGDERGGVNFEVNHVRVASITGTVSGDVANLAGVQLSLIFGGPRESGPAGTQGIASTPPNARGEFRFANMPPGQYRIVARARRGESEAATQPGVVSFSSGGGGIGRGVTALPPPLGGPPAPNVENLFAVADIDVRGQDVTGVNMVLQPGGTLSGRVVFDASTAPVPKDLSSVRVLLAMLDGNYTAMSGTTRVGNALSSLQPVMLGPDGTFTIIGIGPSQYALTFQLPADQAKIWKLRSAIVDGRDLLDSLVEGPSIHLTGVTVTLSDRTTELTGTLQSASGQATADYYLIAFSTDRSQWRAGSRRSLSTKPGTDGRFTFGDLPAGEYFVAALTDLDPLEWQTPAFLEQVAPVATRVTVAEGERKVQDLRIK